MRSADEIHLSADQVSRNNRLVPRRPAKPEARDDSVTSKRPRSFVQGIVSSKGFGEVPAVQTSVFVSIMVPSLNRTVLPEKLSTFLFRRISNLRPRVFARRKSLALSPQFWQDHWPRMNKDDSQHAPLLS